MAALIVQMRVRPDVRFFNQALCEHALYGAVQCAGAEAVLAVGSQSDFPFDCVPVPLSLGKGQQNLENDRSYRNRR